MTEHEQFVQDTWTKFYRDELFNESGELITDPCDVMVINLYHLFSESQGR